MLPPKLPLQDRNPALPSFSKEGFLRRPQSPGTSSLDMNRISPDDSLSRKITGNAALNATDQNITRFRLKALCGSAEINAM